MVSEVYVLNSSDDAVIPDKDGIIHNVFQQDRRLLILSVPKSTEWIPSLCADDAAEQLVHAVAKAME